MSDLASIEQEAIKKFKASLENLAKDLAILRAGRANPAMLDRIDVEVYGSQMNIKELASVAAPDPTSLVITPFDRSTLNAIEKAIQASDLGLNPQNDGSFIRIKVPAPTEERRKELCKVASKTGEEAKIALRNIRQNAQNSFRKLEKEKIISEDELKNAIKKLDKEIDKYNKDIDELVKKKQKEIMEI